MTSPRDDIDDWLKLEGKLPDVLAGKSKPKDMRENLRLIELCRRQQRNAAQYIAEQAGLGHQRQRWRGVRSKQQFQ